MSESSRLNTRNYKNKIKSEKTETDNKRKKNIIKNKKSSKPESKSKKTKTENIEETEYYKKSKKPADYSDTDYDNKKYSDESEYQPKKSTRNNRETDTDYNKTTRESDYTKKSTKSRKNQDYTDTDYTKSKKSTKTRKCDQNSDTDYTKTKKSTKTRKSDQDSETDYNKSKKSTKTRTDTDYQSYTNQTDYNNTRKNTTEYQNQTEYSNNQDQDQDQESNRETNNCQSESTSSCESESCHSEQPCESTNKFEIEYIPPRGITLRKSGVYYLTRNIYWDPICDNIPAIAIDSDNISLDFAGHTLSTYRKNCHQNNCGILVLPNKNNINISNGSIKKLSGIGLFVNPGCGSIKLNNLLFLENGGTGKKKIFVNNNFYHTGGLFIIGSKLKPISDIILSKIRSIKNFSHNFIYGVNGLLMQYTNKAEILDCNFDDNFGPSTVGVNGAEFFFCKNINISNSTANNNINFIAAHLITSLNSHMATSCGGFHFNTESPDLPPPNSLRIQHQNIKITTSEANSNKSSAIRSYGMRFKQINNLLLDSCSACGTVNSSVDSSLLAKPEGNGFIPLNIYQITTGAAGIIISVADNFQVNNSFVSKNMVLDGTQRVVAGFDIAASRFGGLSNCQSDENSNTGGGIFGGFLTEPTLNRLNSTPSVAQSYGINFTDCTASGNTGSTNTGAGFSLFRLNSGSIINNNSNNNIPIGMDIGQTAGTPPYVAATNCLIKNNSLINNTIGIQEANPDFNTYSGNQSQVSGNSEYNFVNLGSGASVVVWNRIGGTVPSPAPSIIDNLSINNNP